ncbi:MAG: ATP-binding protein [Anaerolineales bacterium]|nr:ATP-binding protein [Anaerolineales bacterium]
MAVSNRDRVERVLDALRTGLGPVVLREYRKAYGPGGYLTNIENNVSSAAFQLTLQPGTSDEVLLQQLDVHSLLNLMWRAWNDAFQDLLGHSGRNYVSELMEVRNKWAHQGAFTNDEAYRASDTAALLLRAINATQQAAEAGEVSRELLRVRYEAEAQRSRQDAARTAGVTSQLGLRPWREIISPHPDVASGAYMQAEFAADLAQVLAGTARPEYGDPREFFRRTYLTQGLMDLLVSGIRRLTAQGGDPVVQLQTAFGGGKTHSMLALYHLAAPQFELRDFVGGEELVERTGDVDMPEATRAVLVGTAFSATNPTAHAECSTHTLWGELAYQLGGREGYEMVRAADEGGANPGSDVLVAVLGRYGPCLIIIDELVAYARNIYGVTGLPSGSFEAVMSFVQSLTEAVRRSVDSMLLISIPESDMEVGGRAGRETLESLSHIVGRIDSVWKPVSARESFEIVRRRLFATEVRHAERDATVNAYADLYRGASAEFPSGVAERDYIDLMKAAYPIHPELFERLYEDWSTLERFQRTRGVLRLMAAVIHQLWVRGDQSPLITPGTLPLDSAAVRNEFLHYLPDTWAAVHDRDIDGTESRPFRMDAELPNLGRYNAARRVARTIFVGSAPSVAGQQIRGVEEVRIRLGCAQPGEPTAVFGDALRRMGSELTYLYSDGTRYWYDTRPTVNKLARDRAQGFEAQVVRNEIVERLRKVPRTRDFAAFHVAPPESGDVSDEDRVRLVVLGPESSHRRGAGDSLGIAEARRILQSRGNSQRLNRNMLVFLAPDEADSAALEAAAREYLAWKSISEEEEQLNLDAQQRRQVRESLARAEETLSLRLRGAYSWLLVPVQPDPLGDTELQASRISGDDNPYERAARRLHNDGLLITEWSPDILRMELDRFIWNDERGWEVGLKRLWEYLAQYLYLPRLLDSNVLKATVMAGVRRLDAPIAYATGADSDNYHTGILYRSVGTVYIDDPSLIVHPDHLRRKPIIDVGPKPPIDGGPGPDNGGPKPPPKPKRQVRYYGRVELDAARVNRDVAVIVEEVIERLTSQVGCEVDVSLEIRARKPDGFDEGTIRTISENSHTLAFGTYEFEEE